MKFSVYSFRWNNNSQTCLLDFTLFFTPLYFFFFFFQRFSVFPVFELSIMFYAMGEQLDERLRLFWQPAVLLFTYFVITNVFVVNKMMVLETFQNFCMPALQLGIFGCYYTASFIYCKDPNWYRGKNVDNKEGMIPANYVQERSAVKMSAMPWAAFLFRHLFNNISLSVFG